MPLRRRPTVVILALMIIVVIALMVRNLRQISVSICPTNFQSVTYGDDKVTDHPSPASSTHNFRQLNHVIAEYDSDVAARLSTLVERRSTAADPDLIRLIVDMLDPPSSHMIKLSRHLFNTPQSHEVDTIFKQKVRITRKCFSFCFVAVYYKFTQLIARLVVTQSSQIL